MGSPLPESESFLSYSVRVLKSNIFPSKISEELGNIHRKRPHNVNADLINNTDVFYPFASNKIHQGSLKMGSLKTLASASDLLTMKHSFSQFI